MVDGVFGRSRVFIRQKGNVGLRLGEVVEHPSVCDALAMGSDSSCSKIRDQTLAVTFIQAGRFATTTVV